MKMHITTIMGLWCPPGGNCLGLQPFIEQLRAEVARPELQVVADYWSHADDLFKAGCDWAENFAAADYRILIGHSLGGEQAWEKANVFRCQGTTIHAMCLIDPVPIMKAPDYEFPVLQNVLMTGCFLDGLGHSLRLPDPSIDVAWTQQKLNHSHTGICTAPEVLAWIRNAAMQAAITPDAR